MAGNGSQSKPFNLFYSYSHKDEDFRRKLETHLAAVRRGGLIAEWHDRKLEPGDAWKDEIDRHLMSAEIVLLLVSADFIDSDYCWGEEMTKALARHERGEARVIPVILRHCDWRNTPLASLQAVPRDAKPIKAWLDEDEAFLDVVAAIARAVQSVRQRTEEVPGATAITLASEEPSTVLRQTEIRAGDTLALPDSTVLSRPEIRQRGTVFREVEAPWCPEVVVIPAGSFVMGSPATEEGRSPAEGPQHKVEFAQPFALGCYPVTFEEYDHFCAETKRKKPADQGWGRGRRPAIHVPWKDAKAYVEWLSEQTGQRYRLPSEAEWEYACRAGTTTPFWTGETISTEQANYDGNYTYGRGRKGDYREQTTPVDTFEANLWGLHDMHGNVWEWCEDCWNDSYEGASTDGSAWLQGNCSQRVVRGGSRYDPPGNLRSAGRYRFVPDLRGNGIGFRVSRTLAIQHATSPAKSADWRNQRYDNTSFAGRVTFNYENNNGLYSIGRDEFFFQTKWRPAMTQFIFLEIQHRYRVLLRPRNCGATEKSAIRKPMICPPGCGPSRKVSTPY